MPRIASSRALPLALALAATVTAMVGVAILAQPSRSAAQEPANDPADDIYFSIRDGDTVGGLAIRNEDVVRFDGAAFTMVFDGSDVGLAPLTIDALEMGFGDYEPSGRILLSFTEPANIPGAGLVDDSDIVRFHPTSLGPDTAGTFSLYFDGSDIGLTSDDEDIDAIEFVEFSLLISTTGSFSVTGDSGSALSGQDEDILECYDRRGGADSGCLGFSLIFDGSTVGLTSSSEDIDAFAMLNYNRAGWTWSTTGSFSVAGLSGPNEDLFTCDQLENGSPSACPAFRRVFEGDAYGIAGDITGLELPIQGE